MYKLKDEINPRIIETFGFRLSSDHSSYEIKYSDYTLFIWLTNEDEYYKKNYLYIECEYGCVIDLNYVIKIISIMLNMNLLEGC
jgi:hypothetical protein